VLDDAVLAGRVHRLKHDQDRPAVARIEPFLKILEAFDAALEEIFREKPALHRFPANMAHRVQEHCAFLVSEYGGDPAAVWGGVPDGAELERRLLDLPGIGEMKARTMMGVLAKRLGVRPRGWEAFAPAHESLGDVDSPEALAEYQAAKRARKAAHRAAKSAT